MGLFTTDLATRDTEAWACRGDEETPRCAAWWQKHGGAYPGLNEIAVRVLHMWTSASLAKRNRAKHERVYTTGRNTLEFAKLAELVEIATNFKPLECYEQSTGYALPWGDLDAQEAVESGAADGGSTQSIDKEPETKHSGGGHVPPDSPTLSPPPAERPTVPHHATLSPSSTVMGDVGLPPPLAFPPLPSGTPVSHAPLTLGTGGGPGTIHFGLDVVHDVEVVLMAPGGAEMEQGFSIEQDDANDHNAGPEASEGDDVGVVGGGLSSTAQEELGGTHDCTTPYVPDGIAITPSALIIVERVDAHTVLPLEDQAPVPDTRRGDEDEAGGQLTQGEPHTDLHTVANSQGVEGEGGIRTSSSSEGGLLVGITIASRGASTAEAEGLSTTFDTCSGEGDEVHEGDEGDGGDEGVGGNQKGIDDVDGGDKGDVEDEKDEVEEITGGGEGEQEEESMEGSDVGEFEEDGGSARCNASAAVSFNLSCKWMDKGDITSNKSPDAGRQATAKHIGWRAWWGACGHDELPLLLLVTVLLLAVVVFPICFLGRVPGRKQTRRTPKRGGKMEKVQTKTTLPVRAGGSSHQRCTSTEGGRRLYDPTLYSHLPSHEIPLPPSDDEGDDPRSSTVPLGSVSTQDWMGSQLCRQALTPTYTDLLEGRTPTGYDAGLVDLNFGLRSGSAEDVTHTVLVNPASGTSHTTPSVRASGRPDNHAWCSGQSGNERGLFPPRRGAVGAAGVAASRTRTSGSAPCGSTTPGGTIDGRQDDDECSTAEVVGRKQFKIVHKFMGESGKPNFFTLTLGERKERGFDFRMDERVYSEMTAMSRGDHTIHPTNLADMGAAGGVQMAGRRGGRNESGGSEGCGDGLDDDQGSTRDSTFSGGGGKRKNVRQQTFDTIADVMKEHGNLMATTVDSASKRQCSILMRQCDILERGLKVQKEHYVKADQANFMMGDAIGFGRDGVSREELSTIKQSIVVGVVGTLPRILKAAGVVITEARVPRQLPAVVGQVQPRQPLPLQQAGASGGGKTPSAQKGEATASSSQAAVADQSTKSGLTEGAEEGRVDDVRRDDGRRDGKREGDDDDDRPLVTRLKGAAKENDLEERSKLWVDCDTF
ncbi:hypothetical protein CBR_g48265 [Chara braunii]|uniref:HAT C-terminal dimerisation domain-containing protein n=1 Tax=Chara braunii TaxID=69332 RepID=A0A388M2K0_CHABU|nr:hypothetical protein CBR_g48265 [Chara braunii]|eukprot:GBG88735.1 hypothetical protein CBR_g48265 [Chara braunii]